MNAQDLDAITEQLTAYLDGELSSEEATAIEARLVDDESLRLRLAEMAPFILGRDRRTAGDFLRALKLGPISRRGGP